MESSIYGFVLEKINFLFDIKNTKSFHKIKNQNFIKLELIGNL